MKSVMFVRGLWAIMLLIALGALPGCGENEQTQSKSATVSKEDVQKEAKEAYRSRCRPFGNRRKPD
jgi:hypothetical protein